MKLRKTILSLAMVSLMAASLAMPALAADSSQSLTITTQVTPTYTVVIPEAAGGAITYKATSTKVGTVSLAADTLNLEPGYQVNVTLAGDTLDHAAGVDTIRYNAHFGTEADSKTTALTDSTPAAVSVDITENEWETATAGSYSGILNFVIDYAPMA